MHRLLVSSILKTFYTKTTMNMTKKILQAPPFLKNKIKKVKQKRYHFSIFVYVNTIKPNYSKIKKNQKTKTKMFSLIE